VAMAPEMQFAPQADPSSHWHADLDPQQLATEPPFASVPTADDEVRDEPEVEELWAAAALLGEAIGRLKHTGEAMPPELGGAQALPEAPEDQHAAALLGEELLGEELQPNVARQPSTEQVAIEVDCDLADLLVIDDDEQIDPVVFADPAAAPWPDSLLDLTGANGIEFDAVQALGLPDPERPRSVPTTHQTTPVVTPLVDTVAPQRAPGSIADVSHPKGYVSTASTPQRAARHASSSPITCRLHFPANQKAEGLLRGLLGRDPRVLVTPAPEVRNMMGELEVSFALLPGLPAGERSLLEQQLRDTVA